MDEQAGQGGKKLLFISGSVVINIASDVFGYDGWSSSVVERDICFAESKEGGTEWDVGICTTVRVTLTDGNFHDGVGWRSMENERSRSLASEKAYKEGETDGLKRALGLFGNVLGDCAYDNAYCDKIRKMGYVKSRVDVMFGKLYRLGAESQSESMQGKKRRMRGLDCEDDSMDVHI